MRDEPRRKAARRKAALVLLAMIAGLTAGCGDTTEPGTQPPGPGPDPIPGLVVSNPVAPDATGDPVVYVSLPPGAFPGGVSATITNLRTGAHHSAAIAGGGLDPVAVAAEVGDTIGIEIERSGAEPVRSVQPVREDEALLVLRTEPASGKLDVALDAGVVIVFSEPLDPASVSSHTTAVRHAAGRLTGTLGVSADGLRVTFSPEAELQPGTEYTISVGTGIRGSDGAGPESAFAASFRTRTADLPPAPDSFPPVPPTASMYVRVSGSSDPSERSRYVLYDDGAFALQYVKAPWGFFEYRGRHSAVETSLELRFDADGRWQATGTFAGDSLTVDYNPTMELSDFVDAVYRLVPPTNVLAYSREGDIYIINADGTGLRRVTSGAGEDSEPAWSPDGRWIAFTRYRPDRGLPAWGEATIHLVNADGTGPVQLSTAGDSTYDAHPTWSPDGTRIAFYSRREHEAGASHANDSEIWVMRRDGTGPVRLTDQRSPAFHPAWSPGGDRIAYRAWNDEAEDWSIYVMGADGTDPTAIVTGAGAYAPAWSSDGTRILSRRAECLEWVDPDPAPEIGPDCVEWEGPHLITVLPDGSGLRRLSDYLLNGDDEHSTPATWSADGLLVAFTQIACPWPRRQEDCESASHIEVLRLPGGQVGRLTEGSSPNWLR